jgi:hypothetical protein
MQINIKVYIFHVFMYLGQLTQKLQAGFDSRAGIEQVAKSIADEVE